MQVRLQYRALEGTNTKTRRLAYLTALITLLRRDSLTDAILLSRLARWNNDHRADLNQYWVQTGEVTSTRRNSAGARYLQLATKTRLLTPVASQYRVTRVGLVLFALVRCYGINSNPFALSPVERLFLCHRLLTVDADLLLTLVDRLNLTEAASLRELQNGFQGDLLRRLEQKLIVERDEGLRQQLFQRRSQISREWTNPVRYAEHLVPPRLNWLLDLGLLDPEQFRRHKYALGPAGRQFLAALPRMPGAESHDVTDGWLASDYWRAMAEALLTTDRLLLWDQVDEECIHQYMEKLIRQTFDAFPSQFVARVSLTQAMLYLSARFMFDHRIVASPSALTSWFASSRSIGDRRYELRSSPRENESYVLAVLETAR